MKKKILLMVPMLHQGGFERVCIRTARLLQEHCEVYLLIFNGEDIAYDINGLHVIDINIKGKNGISNKVCNVWRRVYKVKLIKRKLGIQITYSFGITANLVNVLSKTQDVIWIGIRGFTDLGSKLHSVLCKKADEIICCSKLIEEIVKKEFPQKSSVTIYNPYDIKTMQEQAGETIPQQDESLFENHRVIISMAREDEVKGFWHLIRSFSMLHKELPDTVLMIIGEGEYRENKQFAQELGIADKVIFTGVKKNPFPYLKRAAVYALTSFHEGFPNALVEAMALGIPVVAANCKSGPAEILCGDYRKAEDDTKVYHAEYGVLLPVLKEEKNLGTHLLEKEEEILASELLQMLQKKDLREKYQKAGYKRAMEFSDKAYVDALLGNIEKQLY